MLLQGLRQILQREMGRTSPRGKSRKPLTLSSEDEEVSFSLQLRSAQENEKENEDPVTVSDEGKERNPRKRRKKVRAVRRLKKGGQLAGGGEYYRELRVDPEIVTNMLKGLWI